MATMIKLTGINKIYRTEEIETQALENVNLEVQKGEFLSIMGPSGCGKSTLLNIMGLLDSPTSGTIEINGTNTINMGDKELAAFRNKTLGFVFQSFHLINSLNVIDNVELPLLYRKMSSSERTALAEQMSLSYHIFEALRPYPVCKWIHSINLTLCPRRPSDQHSMITVYQIISVFAIGSFLFCKSVQQRSCPLSVLSAENGINIQKRP